MTQHTAGPTESAYEAHRPLIDQIIGGTGRQHSLSSDEASEFRSFAWERLLAADPLARFQQRCSVRTFLTIVIGNYFRDFRNHRWGKWRPSSEARRLGPVAVRLEALVARDGFSFDEAAQIIETNDRGAVSRRELEAIHLRLPIRSRVRLVSDELLDDVAGAPVDFDGSLNRDRHLALAGQIRQALGAALDLLDPEDRIILKLLFETGFTVAQVANAMHLPQKPLYRRRDQLLALLRTHLLTAGIDATDVDAAIGTLDTDEHPAVRGAGDARSTPLTGRRGTT